MTAARSCAGSRASAARTCASPLVPDRTLVGTSSVGPAAPPSRRPSSSARPNHQPARSPTVSRLEEEVADRFGLPAAMFVPSGTMGNQIAMRLLVPPADELICDADAHVVSYEGGGAAQHGGLQTRTLVAPRGLLTPAALEP